MVFWVILFARCFLKWTLRTVLHNPYSVWATEQLHSWFGTLGWERTERARRSFSWLYTKVQKNCSRKICLLRRAHEIRSLITISVVWRKRDFNRYSVAACHSNTAPKGRKESFRCHCLELLFIAFSWIRSKIKAKPEALILLSLPTSPPVGCWERDEVMPLKAAETNTEMNESCTQTQLYKNQNFCWNLAWLNFWN